MKSTLLGLALAAGCTPPGPRAVLEGERLIRDGKYDRAVQRLEEGVRLLPRNAAVWNHLGLAYQYSGRKDDAVKAYQRALTLNRDLVAARHNLGCLYLEQGNAAAAVAELTTSTSLQPNSYPSWIQLGTAQFRARQVDAAERSFLQAQKLNPVAPEAWNGLGLVQMQRRRYEEAHQRFMSALKLQPNYAPALLNAAVVSQEHLNSRAAALQKYQSYLALTPPPPHAANVREIVARLEMELRPPTVSSSPLQSTQSVAVARPSVVPASKTPTGSTNRPSTTNNPSLVSRPVPAATTATQLVASATPQPQPPLQATFAATSAPPTRLAATNRAPSTHAEPAPAPRTQALEVVRLDPEEPIKPVREVTSAPLPRPKETEPPPLARTPIPPAPAVTVAPASPGPSTSTSPPRKTGFISRLNPVSWFRSSDKTAAASPDGSGPAGESTGLNKGNPPPALSGIAREESRPPAPTSGFPRYKYHSPSPPNSGNRADAERLVAEGLRAQERNRLNDAIESYRRAARADPSLFEAHYNLGVALFEAGDLPQTLAAYENALAVNGASEKARFNFAIALQRANYPRDAADELERLLAQDPAIGRAHLALATLYAQQLGESSIARRHYVRVLELEPQHPQATAIRYWLEANP